MTDFPAPSSSRTRYRSAEIVEIAKRRVTAILLGLGVSVATTVLMLLTEPPLAIAWDEGYTLGREERLCEWFAGLGDPARFAAEWKPHSDDDELVPGPVSVRPPSA